MRRWHPRRHLAGWLISLAVACSALGLVWWPEWQHWHVSPAGVDDRTLAALRGAPDDATLAELARLQLRGVMVAAPDTVAAAEAALHGELRLPTFPPAPISDPFDPADLTHGTAAWQLMTASMAAADVLLDGYLLTKQEPMLARARAYLDGFARFEAERWVDHGLMWNDHAISARVPVLIKLWSIERHRPDADPARLRRLLQLAERSALLLARPSAYAWRTSHGILADLALLQLAAAFPGMTEADPAKRTAADRLARHLPYWIDDEGVTLLHSAGYHAGSMYHFSMGLRLFTLNGLPISSDWWTRFDRAVEHLAQLQRPDGTLPMYGDTNSAAQTDTPLLTTHLPGSLQAQALAPRALPSARPGLSLYPVAGHGIVWDLAGADAVATAQTTVTWSYHPGLGHKLADEPSLLIWADGHPWLTNVGYWPYGIEGRADAESWRGANAPHLHDEPAGSARRTALIGSASSPSLHLLDLHRVGPDGFEVRRQVLRLPDMDAWLVLDNSTDRETRQRDTLWQFYPGLQARALDSSGTSFELGAPDRASVLRVHVDGQPAVQVQSHRGSRSPFGGWVVMDRVPTEAPALELSQPSPQAWTLTAMVRLPVKPTGAVTATGARVAHWGGPEDWTVQLNVDGGAATIQRDAQRLTVSSGDRRQTVVPISQAPDPGAGVQAIQTAFASAVHGTEHFSERYPYRIWVSEMLAALLVLQELTLGAIAWLRTGASRWLRAMTWPLWIIGGLWLSRVYLA